MAFELGTEILELHIGCVCFLGTPQNGGFPFGFPLKDHEGETSEQEIVFRPGCLDSLARGPTAGQGSTHGHRMAIAWPAHREAECRRRASALRGLLMRPYLERRNIKIGESFSVDGKLFGFSGFSLAFLGCSGLASGSRRSLAVNHPLTFFRALCLSLGAGPRGDASQHVEWRRSHHCIIHFDSLPARVRLLDWHTYTQKCCSFPPEGERLGLGLSWESQAVDPCRHFERCEGQGPKE